MIKELTDKNYSEMINNYNGIFFVDFYSPSCGPCQNLSEFLPHLENKYIDNKIKFLKCNITENPKIVSKYQIRSVPLTLIINEKKEIKDATLGLQQMDYYFNLIDKYILKKKSSKNKSKLWWKFW